MKLYLIKIVEDFGLYSFVISKQRGGQQKQFEYNYNGADIGFGRQRSFHLFRYDGRLLQVVILEIVLEWYKDIGAAVPWSTA